MTPIRVADTPGFVVNRIARPFYLEALRIVEAGGRPREVDAALRGEGFRIGPLELADLIGMDVNLAVSESLFERSYYQPRFRPSTLQRSMVEAGLLGRKSGRGFYDYGDEGQGETQEEGPLFSANRSVGNHGAWKSFWLRWLGIYASWSRP